jgi:hypothetical protein
MLEALSARLAAAAPLASARAAWSMATPGEHFRSVCQGSWGDQPPPALAYTLLGGSDQFKGRTPSYEEFYELDGKLWVQYTDHGLLVYSRDDGHMTEQRGHIRGGRRIAELFRRPSVCVTWTVHCLALVLSYVEPATE